MKALKTVAVALGITLGALIVIPLVVLAGLFVWLKLTEEDDEEILELDRKAPDPTTARSADETPAGPAGVELSAAAAIRSRRRARRAGRARRDPARTRPPPRRARRPRRHGHLGRQLHRRQGRDRRRCRRSAFTFLRFSLAAIDAARRSCAGARARPAAAPATRPDRRARRPRVRRLPDPVDGRPPDDPGRRLRAAHRRDAGPRRAARGRRRHGPPHRGQARRRARLVRGRRRRHRRRRRDRARRRRSSATR